MHKEAEKNLKHRRAFTLVEVVLVVGMIAVVAGVLVGLVQSSYEDFQLGSNRSILLQDGQAVMELMVRILRQATGFSAVSQSTDQAGYITFANVDGTTEQFKLNTETSELEYGEPNSLSALTGSVDSLVFTCYDVNGDTLAGSVPAGKIRSVQIETTLSEGGESFTFLGRVFCQTDLSNLVGWWKMDDASGLTATDSSGYDNHGTLTNMAGNEWTTGVLGGALAFDGSNDYVDCGNASTLDLTGEITIALWVNTADSGNGQNNPYVTKGDHAYAIKHKSGNSIEFFIYDDNWYTTSYSVSSSFNGEWHHLAGTYDGSELNLYIDGELQDTTSHTGSISTSSYALNMGRNSEQTSRFYEGSVDDVRIYNRALSAEEVAQLANILKFRQFTEAKVASDDTSITIPTPGAGAVAILGSWTSGLTHTAESGSNRLLVFTAHAEEGGYISLNSVTYGGQTMTKVIEESAGNYWARAYIATFILDEADITAATSDTFVPSWSTTPDNVSYSSVFLSGVDQTTHIGDTAGNGTAYSWPNPITTSALSTNENDMVIVAATCGNTGDYTVNSGFTKAIELDMSSSTGVAGYKSAMGASETPSVTHSSANIQVIAGLVVQGTASSDIEGDLLVAAVATDGYTSSSLAPPGGEGWTEIDVDDYSSAVTLGAWWKLADASESSSHEFTWSGGQQAYGWMMRFTGHDPDEPINDYTADGESSSTPTSPAVTTTVENCLILRLGAFDDRDITEDDPGLLDHTAITMDESGSGGSGNVTILGSWTTGLTHTAETGTNRALIFVTQWEDNVAPNLISVTYGGQAMTKVIDVTAGTSYRNYVAAFVLNETGIAAATSGTFVATWGNTPSSVSYDSVFLQNVNQADIIGDTDSASTTYGTDPIQTGPLSTAEGDMVILAAVCGNNGSYTLNNGFTEGNDQSVGSNGHTGVTGHKSATGANETPRADYSATVNRQAIIGLVVQAGGGTGTVSGGAGYIRQSDVGDSGTSSFTLGSSNQAQALTIAIAPEP